jgi:carboxymethylenebutenolidase
MCHEANARPAAPPATTGTARGEDLLLTSADGTRFAAHLARPERPGAAQIVLLPDAKGLHPFYRELALRFAETGSPTLVIDYFGRSAGPGPRGDGFDFRAHLEEVRRDAVLADVDAAVDHLRGREDAAERTFVAGFCMGGGLALLAGARRSDLAGVIAFYAWTGETGHDEALPHEFVRDIRCPVLGLFGEADQVIPAAVPRALDKHLAAAGVPHEIVIYPGAPHGFFELHEMDSAQYAGASTDAWRRLLGFLAAA